MRTCLRCGKTLYWREGETEEMYSIEIRHYEPGHRTMFVAIEVCALCWWKLPGLIAWLGQRPVWRT